MNESYDLEFKSAKGGLPRSLWESYSAFANSEGGTIILGVSEKDNYCYLDGLGEDGICLVEKSKRTGRGTSGINGKNRTVCRSRFLILQKQKTAQKRHWYR